MDSVSVEDWGREIFTKGVGVKWKKMGKGRRRKKKTNSYPVSAPTFYWSSIQLQS